MNPRPAHRAYTGVRDVTSVTLPRFAWSIGRVLRHVDGDPDFAVLVCREGAWAPVYLEVVRVRVGRRIDPDQTPDWGHANHNEVPLGVLPLLGGRSGACHLSAESLCQSWSGLAAGAGSDRQHHAARQCN
jgi:hypothetical protein